MPSDAFYITVYAFYIAVYGFYIAAQYALCLMCPSNPSQCQTLSATSEECCRDASLIAFRLCKWATLTYAYVSTAFGLHSDIHVLGMHAATRFAPCVIHISICTYNCTSEHVHFIYTSCINTFFGKQTGLICIPAATWLGVMRVHHSAASLFDIFCLKVYHCITSLYIHLCTFICIPLYLYKSVFFCAYKWVCKCGIIVPNVITGDVIRTDTYRWSADKTECSERQQYCCCRRTGLDEIYCLVRQHICDILRTLYTIYLPTNPYTVYGLVHLYDDLYDWI